MTAGKQGWKFPMDFWLANSMELFERAAYYGFFIVLTLYLTDIVGFSDKETGIVAGLFYGGLYLLPPFVGAISDRIGFKNGLILAFSLLTFGYAMLGLQPVVESKTMVILFLLIVMVGSSFIKPLITGTVAKTTTEANRARGYSLFYWVVNIGAFSGKTFVPFIRQGMGLRHVNFFSAGMAFAALLFAVFVFKNIEAPEERKSVREVFHALVKILTTPRLIILTLIVAGFWTIQGQMYATMPKYIIRMVGPGARPEWLANVNPAVVVLFVVLITHWTKKYKAVTAMLMGMVLMPFSAFAMSAGPWLQHIAGNSIPILGMVLHPFTVMMIVGIAIQGLAECFISPRFLEFFSLMAPRGEEGVYLGFSHLHSFISALVGFFMSGFLLDAYCPDPKTLASLPEAERAAHYAHAHYIWYYFVAIGFTAAIALFIFRLVTNKMDKAPVLQSEQK
ncbi:MAG: peptide MFS transporter [Acidobacteria bacterium]|nr:peptide MFS transporter [Acidobacteriota bacterium]